MCVQVISLAGWVNIMYYIQDAHSFWAWLYFVALIVVSEMVAMAIGMTVVIEDLR